MKIYVTSLMLDDQEKALQFYTQILGFRLKQDVPVGEYRWLTLVSPEQPDGVELLLEPDVHPAAKAFKPRLRQMVLLIPHFRSTILRQNISVYSR
ncbi:VOC family protein [Acinetobacter indicus]|uniref:VOC family protein n=1 Tax=Acinetobacter indicus TaxID=756892 RepID=UPI002B417002|nr:VOC family protein [Acinetobacter indicus]